MNLKNEISRKAEMSSMMHLSRPFDTYIENTTVSDNQNQVTGLQAISVVGNNQS